MMRCLTKVAHGIHYVLDHDDICWRREALAGREASAESIKKNKRVN
jgi:hypothetical protein